MALFIGGQGARADVVLNTGVGGATYTGGFVAVPITVQSDAQLAAYLTLNPVVANPVFSSVFTPVTVVPGFPIPPWMGNGPNSNWIGPSSNGAADGAGTPPLSPFVFPGYSSALSSPQGEYYYTTTFTGIPTSVSGLQWTSDNQGLKIFLNGHDEGPVLNTGDFTKFAPFSLNPADFVAGLNTLTFVTFNEEYGASHASPTGIRIEGRLVTAIPEPGMMTLAVVGALPILGLYWARRRRAQG